MSQTLETQSQGPSKAVAAFVAGLVFVVVGVLIKDQPWVKPEMFAALDLDLSKVVMNIGIFIAWVGVINIYFYKPMRGIIEKRTSVLEQTFTEAAQLKTQIDEIKTSYEQRIAATEAEARATIQAQIREAQTLRQTLAAEAAQKYDDMISKADADIEAERQRVIGDLQTTVITLTLGATEKLLGESVDNEKSRKLVAEYIATAGTPA